MHIIPWILCGATAAWLAFEARRSERVWPLWAVGGAVCALAVSTILLGLARAATIPIWPGAYARAYLYATLISVVVVALSGLFLLRVLAADGSSLDRFWRKITNRV